MAARSRSTEDLPEAKPRNDAYVGLLGISLLAMITGCVLLYLDYSQYPDKKPPAYTPPAIKATTPPATAPATPGPGTTAPATTPAGAPPAANNPVPAQNK